MKEHTTGQIRNLAVIGHATVGKTTLVEAMLFCAGELTRMGKVEEGSTRSDYSAEEIARRISISDSLLHCAWRDTQLNIVDTPGYVDFTGEVKGALYAVDNALVVVDPVEGVEVGTDLVWRYAADYGLSRLFFVNRMDKERADFDQICDLLTTRFGTGAVPLCLPLDQGEGFSSIVDLVRRKAYVFSTDGSGKFEEKSIPDEAADKAERLREKLVEGVAESDEALMEKYFDEGGLSDNDLVAGLRKGVVEGQVFPILCGDAVHNIGVRLLLDAITSYLASPADRPPIVGTDAATKEEVSVGADPSAPLTAVVFKTVSEPHVGELSLFRVFSGTLTSGDEVQNTTRSTTEKIGQIYLMNGKERREIGNVSAGGIGALVKLKGTHTGDALSDRRRRLYLPPIEFPKPVIRVAVAPKAKGDEDKISTGLGRLHEEDPTFLAEVDGELKQIIVSGQGELHLEVVIKKLKDRFGVDVEVIEPRIPYRETIRGSAECQHRYKKQTGGRGQFGEVYLRLAPMERGAGLEFVDKVTGGVIPSKFIPAVEKGVVEAMSQGVLSGHRVVDTQVTVYYGSYHPVDSSEMAFKLAASMAFKKGFREARPVLLEPIYDLEVTVPEAYMGDVMGDISGRRGKILGMEQSGALEVIRAQVPLAELYRYSTTLRSLTQGRGLHTREFSHYEEVPHDVAEKVIAASQKEEA